MVNSSMRAYRPLVVKDAAAGLQLLLERDSCVPLLAEENREALRSLRKLLSDGAVVLPLNAQTMLSLLQEAQLFNWGADLSEPAVKLMAALAVVTDPTQKEPTSALTIVRDSENWQWVKAETGGGWFLIGKKAGHDGWGLTWKSLVEKHGPMTMKERVA